MVIESGGVYENKSAQLAPQKCQKYGRHAQLIKSDKTYCAWLSLELWLRGVIQEILGSIYDPMNSELCKNSAQLR